MTRKLTLTLLLLLAVFATGRAADTAAPADTLLSVGKAGNVAIVSSPSCTVITISNLDGGADNFYYQSGKPKNWGSITETRINCPNITDVTVCETPDNITVSYTSPEGGAQSYTFSFDDPDNRSFKSYIGRKGSDFGFTISRSHKTEWSVITDGLGFGWVTPIKENPEMNTSMWKSNELTWTMVLGVRMSHRAHSLSFGLGLNWQNFVTKGNRYFHKNDDGRISLEAYEEGVTDTRSRIKLFSLQVPVLYGLKFGHKRYMGLQVGPVVNFNTSSSIKTQYKLDGREYSIKTSKIGQRPVTVDALATITYRSFGVYCRYSPMKKLRTRAELDFGSLSTGLWIGL